MELKNNNEIINFLKTETKNNEFYFMLNTLKFYAVMKIRNNDFEFPPDELIKSNFNKTDEWYDGIIFNGDMQIKFQRIDNEKIAVSKNIFSKDCEYLEKDFLLLGLPERTENNWTFMSEYSIKGYWIPGDFSAKNKIALKGREIIGYDDNKNAYVKDIQFFSFK